MGFGDTGAAERAAAKKKEEEALEKQKAEEELNDAQDDLAKQTNAEKDVLAANDSDDYEYDSLSDVVNVGQLKDEDDEKYKNNKLIVEGKTTSKKKKSDKTWQ